MAGHTLSRPLHLTDPAPGEAAAGLGADHVHAPAVPLRCRPAAGAWFGDDPDRDGAGVGSDPAGPRRPRVPREKGHGSVTTAAARLSGVAGKAWAQVGALRTVAAENVTALQTRYSPARV